MDDYSVNDTFDQFDAQKTAEELYLPIAKNLLLAVLINLKKDQDANKLKGKIQSVLETKGLRLGMVYSASSSQKCTEHPYPTIVLNLVDKSSNPFELIQLRLNSAGTILQEKRKRDHQTQHEWFDVFLHGPVDPRKAVDDNLDD